MEDEEINSEFACTICLELLSFKPLVLTCGHLICQECYTRLLEESIFPGPKCPLCPQRITHFPDVCPVIEKITKYAFPESYTKRSKKLRMETSDSSGSEQERLDELRVHLNCPKCGDLLSLPVAFACGHVCCKTCMIKEDGTFKCAVCEIPQWSFEPVVCARLRSFIEETYTEETQKNLGELWCRDITLVHAANKCFKCKLCPITGDCYLCKECDKGTNNGICYCQQCFEMLTDKPKSLPSKPYHREDHEFCLRPPISVRNKILLEAKKTPEMEGNRRPRSVVYCLSRDSYVFSFKGVNFAGKEHGQAVRVKIEEDDADHH